MTLIVALKTDKEVYLATDSLGYRFDYDNNLEFFLCQKYKKFNEHVEVLISGVLNDGLRFIEEARRALKRVDLEKYDAFEIAKEIDKVATPAYKRIIDIPPIKKALRKNEALLLEEWPLDMLVCGMDKDKKDCFTKPAIYELQVKHAFLFSEVDKRLAVVSHPSVVSVAEPLFEDRLKKHTLAVDYEKTIHSCFVDVIDKMKKNLKDGQKSTIGEPIHIARITKEGYDILRGV